MDTCIAIHHDESVPGPGAAVARFLRLHNPFYLLSALCMLAGCWLLAGSLTGAEHAARLARVWTLAGLLHLYEFMLLGLAVFLFRRRLERDAKLLLLIELVFLVDATNLCSESWTLGLRNGLLMSSVALALGVAKAALVIWGLGLKPSPRALAALAVAGVALVGAPGILAAFNRTGMSMALPVHGGWWLLSAAFLAVFFLLRRLPAGRSALEVFLGRAAAVALLGSLLVHTAAASWLYGADFQVSHLAPLLVALTVVSWHLEPGRILRQTELGALRAGLPVAAVLCGMAFPESLVSAPAFMDGVPFSPLRGVLLALAAAFALLAAGAALSLKRGKVIEEKGGPTDA